MTTTTPTTGPVLGVLARQEIRHYLGSKLYWTGTALLTVVTVLGFVSPDSGATKGYNPSSAMDDIVPAALLGVFGLIITAGLVKRSDSAAAAAGSVAVPERTRTLAVAAAIVVPVATALVWFVASVIRYYAMPPDPTTVPFGPIGDGFVLLALFAGGVLAALGGPVLGLVIARWLPRRGVTPLAVVLLVLVTILMQGNFESTWRWRVVWPWTAWYGPIGWDTGDTHWLALPGSPLAWIGYLLALCALGVLVAVAHDPEADRARLRPAIAAVAVVAVVTLVLTMTLGLGEATPNPLAR